VWYNGGMVQEVDGVLVVAHELKAPLAVMRQLALLFDGLEGENEQIRDEMIEVSERAIRQVNDLARIGRLEDGLFEMEPVAVRGICDEVTREVLSLFKAERRGLMVKYANRSRVVTANRELLKSVIYNFLSNAAHYSEEGTEAELIVRERHGRIRITIRDFGPALPAKIWREIKKGGINEPTEIAMRPGSSGLGLFIASKFAKYMRGEVGAIRHRDGTSFFIELPVSKQASLWEMGL